jgi:hypothetical protein
VQNSSLLIYGHIDYLQNSAGNEKRVYNYIKYLISQNFTVYYYLTSKNKLHKNHQEVNFSKTANYLIESLDGVNLNLLSSSNINDLLNIVINNGLNLKAIVCEYVFNSIFLYYLEKHSKDNKNTLKIIDLLDKVSNKPTDNYFYMNIEDEISYMNMADICICISNKEYKQYMQRNDLSCKLILTKLDCVYPGTKEIIPEKNQYLFMCGSNNEFNVKYSKEFIENIWIPSLSEHDKLLYISGDVCNELKTFDGKHNIKLLCRLNSDALNTYIQNSLFCLNPIYVGTGLKVKSLTYLENYKYILSYEEGLSSIDIEDIAPVKNQTDFYNQMIFLIQNLEFIKDQEEKIKIFINNNTSDIVYQNFIEILI